MGVAEGARAHGPSGTRPMLRHVQENQKQAVQLRVAEHGKQWNKNRVCDCEV